MIYEQSQACLVHGQIRVLARIQLYYIRKISKAFGIYKRVDQFNKDNSFRRPWACEQINAAKIEENPDSA